jgi:hypothetical protein
MVDPALAEGGLRFERTTPPGPAGPPARRDPDAEGARLIALNMALNGSSREDVDRYLDENFNLADRAGLLAEVFASVEG